MRQIILLCLTFSILNCSKYKGVEVVLHSPDGKFEFEEITFEILRIRPGFSLATDFEKIREIDAVYLPEKKTLKKNWFFTHYLDLDADTDYLIRYSGVNYPRTPIIMPRYLPIFKNRANKINLYTKFNPVIKVRFSADGNPKNLKFSWEALPDVTFYSLYVTPVNRRGPQPDTVLSCFIKDQTSISIEEAFKWVSKNGQDFPNIPQKIITYSNIRRLEPGTYEFAIRAWVHDPQLAKYEMITDSDHPDTKTEIIINPY